MSYLEINQIQMRIIGCLIEKEITTPDQYPLSVNSLVSACNQKSSRDPVTHYTEIKVQDTLDTLVERGLVTQVSASGGRVSKYQHRFCNTEFSDLQLSSAELAIICLLFVRGPQTPGELRTRSGRLHNFQNREEVESALQTLQDKTGGPYVEPLVREAGKRESRYQECFCTDRPITPDIDNNNAPDTYDSALKTRVEELETLVLTLSERIEILENASGL